MQNNPEVVDSIDRLSLKLDRFSHALNTASDTVKLEGDSEISNKQLFDMLNQVLDQNEKIARGIIEVIELIKKMQPIPGPIGPRPPTGPRPMMPQRQQPMPPMQPRPMVPQRQQPMPPMQPGKGFLPPLPGQQPIHKTMPGMNLPPPPPPPSPDFERKPKKSLNLFGK